MKRSEFYKFVKEKTENLLQLLERKAKEYAKEDSAFHNFNEGFMLSTCHSREEYCWNLRVKHLQSIKDIIEAQVKNRPNIELIDEKFGDDLAYNLLIWAMLAENSDL